MEEQRRRQEEARLNALPVSARIIVRPTTSTALPNVVSRMNFDSDIDFQVSLFYLFLFDRSTAQSSRAPETRTSIRSSTSNNCFALSRGTCTYARVTVGSAQGTCMYMVSGVVLGLRCPNFVREFTKQAFLPVVSIGKRS